MEGEGRSGDVIGLQQQGLRVEPYMPFSSMP